MKSLYSFNFISRLIFLLLTPVFFQAINFGFIWHSFYWGTITFVVMIWAFFILISPLVGRVGCGWFCFIGTVQDLVNDHSIFHNKWKKPNKWIRLLVVFLFFSSALTFFFINIRSGKISSVQFNPGWLGLEFNTHYKHVWIYDLTGAFVFALLLDRRWMCKNICFMGALCAAGANYSRLIPVVDKDKCNLCGKCEKICLVRLPITDYIKNNHGLVTNSECILCGKCVEICKPGAIHLKFVWSRKKYRNKRLINNC